MGREEKWWWDGILLFLPLVPRCSAAAGQPACPGAWSRQENAGDWMETPHRTGHRERTGGLAFGLGKMTSETRAKKEIFKVSQKRLLNNESWFADEDFLLLHFIIRSFSTFSCQQFVLTGGVRTHLIGLFVLA